MNSVFIDSNVIIRYFAGDTSAKRLLEPVFQGDVKGYINSVVFSEVVFITVKLLTGKKAYELRRTPETVKEAAKTMTHHLQFLQEYFVELEVNSEVKELAVKIMEEYGLLPNDSLQP